jgi:uncharacterized protein
MSRIARRHERIAIDPGVMGGKPCIKGTRIPVELILEKLAQGLSFEELLEAYPGLTAEDLRAAGAFGRADARAMPPALLDAVVAHFDPLRVILFGSRARGTSGTDSDVDLLVVLDDDAPAAKLGWRSAFEARKDFHQAVDIVPCRRRWFEDRRVVIGSLAHMAAEDGVVIYERP